MVFGGEGTLLYATSIDLSKLEHVEIGFGDAGYVIDDDGTLDTSDGKAVFTITDEMLRSDYFDFFAVNPNAAGEHPNLVLHPETMNSSTILLDHQSTSPLSFVGRDEPVVTDIDLPGRKSKRRNIPFPVLAESLGEFRYG